MDKNLEAIRHFRAYVRLLDEEAGLKPSPRLTEMLQPLPAPGRV